MKSFVSLLTGVLTGTMLFCQSVSASAAGYGQGVEVDGENRPLGALEFQGEYADYGAYAMTEEENRILLTFDQGYENGYTAAILDTLQEKGVTAIFFLTGDYAKSEPELIQRMIDEGHVLGNHSMNHQSFPTLSQEEAQEELMALHQYVLEEYDYTMQYFRFPCGEYSEETLSLVQENGYRTLFWSDAYVDWEVDAQPDPTESLQRLQSHAHSGEILLLHSVSETNAMLLGDLIDGLREDGFTV